MAHTCGPSSLQVLALSTGGLRPSSCAQHWHGRCLGHPRPSKVVMFTDLDCLHTLAGSRAPSLTHLEELAEASGEEVEALLGGVAVSSGRTVFDVYHERWGTLSPRLIPAAYSGTRASDRSSPRLPATSLSRVAGSWPTGASASTPASARRPSRAVAFCLAARDTPASPVLFSGRG